MNREGLHPWDEKTFLKAQDTKYLMTLRDACLAYGHGEYNLFEYGECVVHHANIVAELSTRPHLPSKKEAKTLRRIMSQTGLTESEIRAIPKYADELALSQGKTVISKERAALYAKAAPSLLKGVRVE